MAKFQSPLLGYNNNVRHRGRIFHIQTEDSGVNHPHIITHLFMDGGRILKSVKKSYAEHVGSDGMSETVRVLMKEQHKAMFIALRDGQFDELVGGGAKRPSGATVAPIAKPAVEAAPKEPKEPTAIAAILPPPVVEVVPEARLPESTEIAVNDMAVVPVATISAEIQLPNDIPLPADVALPNDITIIDSKASPATHPGPPRGHEEHVPVTIDEGRRVAASHHFHLGDIGPQDSPLGHADPALPPEIEALLREDPPPRSIPDAEPKTTREPGMQRPSAEELTLDFDALERDSQSSVSAIYRQTDLPPPPKNLFAKEPRTGTYSTVEADTQPDWALIPASRPQPSTGPGVPTPPQPQGRASSVPRASSPKPASEGRYAPARPAAIFGAAAKPRPSPSIFSDDLVSDKSLDEVILSYLAEDLDPPRRK